jgi:hypothetical protein
MSKIALSPNASGTGVFTIASPNSNTDRTLNLPDNSGTLLTTATPGVPVNGPTFNVGVGGSVSLTASTWTKITLTIETFDVGSCFDTSTSRFTPNVAGYYQISANVSMNQGTSIAIIPAIYKNGSAFRRGTRMPISNQAGAVGLSTVVFLNGTTDYVELYMFTESANSTESDSQFTWMSGALVRAA